MTLSVDKNTTDIAGDTPKYHPSRRHSLNVQTMEAMVVIYCHHHHSDLKRKGSERLCTSCASFLNYAHQRLTRCIFGDQKPVCQKCLVHCYRPKEAKMAQEVMRFAGPQMLWRHPLLSLYHLYERLHFKSWQVKDFSCQNHGDCQSCEHPHSHITTSSEA